MCDKNGNVMDEMGSIIGKAELVPESEREGEKTGPFADFEGSTVTKDGKVVDAKGEIIGRLVAGDAKILFGKVVDADGDILDKNGNTVGKAERWAEEEKETPKHPALGRKINKKGDVVDENGDVIAKLTTGEIQNCAGKEIDDDGDVKDHKGTVLGHITLLEDFPEPEIVDQHPAVGRKVNKKGEVVDENGDIVAKLTRGDILNCSGKEIDNDGDVKDRKGNIVGHITLLEDIPEPEIVAEPEVVEEPKETENEAAERKQLEEDKKLAGRLAGLVEQSIDKIKPILKMITDVTPSSMFN